MKVLVLLNASAGAGLVGADDRVRAAFRAVGVDAEVLALRGADMGARAREAIRSAVDAVVAGGGDGTVSTVAGALAGTSTPLGVLPLGTLNHFAKDLEIPLVLEDAVQTIAGGFSRSVDVGEVNGHVFVNNSGLGLYPHILRERDESRFRFRLNKGLALARACLSVFRRYPLLEVRLAAGPQRESLTTPLIFVGNNKYETNFLSVRGRSSLDQGQLCLYLVKGRGRFTLVRLALRALFGRLDQDRDFYGICLSEVIVDARRRHIWVAVDGEVIRLKPPLHSRVRPAALKVLVPSRAKR